MGAVFTFVSTTLISVLLFSAPGFSSNFGIEGNDGSNGRNSRPGTDGISITSVADGSVRSINTYGMDGARAGL